MVLDNVLLVLQAIANYVVVEEHCMQKAKHVNRDLEIQAIQKSLPTMPINVQTYLANSVNNALQVVD